MKSLADQLLETPVAEGMGGDRMAKLAAILKHCGTSAEGIQALISLPTLNLSNTDLRTLAEAVGASHVFKTPRRPQNVQNFVTEAAGGTLQIVTPGVVHITNGEARSADAKTGDTFVVQRENDHYMFGVLQPKASFTHAAGLSGRRDLGSGKPASVAGIEFAIGKDYVDSDKESDFWATAKTIS